MKEGTLIWAVVALPILGSVACLALRSARAVLAATIAGALAAAGVGVAAAARVFARGPIETAGGWIRIDALSAYHLVVLLLVSCLSALYGWGYFAREIEAGTFSPRSARRYGALWFGAFAAMTLVLVSNNLGMLWVGIEASTLLTAFLICVHATPAALEAMWKYLVMCSVGVAFAFLGTLLVAASAHALPFGPSDALLWTRLLDAAGSLDPVPLKVGFLFLLVGYGTKVGLAPMHSWLPDAHSQAPAPVSAIFSGFLLNAALYCLLRYVPLLEGATGASGWSLRLMAFFGILSILVASGFILFQRDVKRLLAYHSVEHLGIIALGVGMGGLGTFAALLHTLNHSLCKSLGFFCAGRLGQIYGTHDMERMGQVWRASPVWGAGFLGSLLVLIGVAPFAIFLSEFLILKAAADRGSYVALALFLLGAGIVFCGALRHAISMTWGGAHEEPRAERSGLLDAALVVGPMAALLLLGIWIPDTLRTAIEKAAGIVGGAP